MKRSEMAAEILSVGALRKSIIFSEHSLKGNGVKLAIESLIALLNLTPLG